MTVSKNPVPYQMNPSDLFVTPEFRESKWVGRLLAEIVGQVWVCDHEPIRGHFGTYFGSLYRRTYENKYIQDLYHLHELTHVRHTRYDAATTFDQWHTKMLDAEFKASLTSECLAYLHIPGLRAKTFEHVIWIDRFCRLDRVQLAREAISKYEITLRQERAITQPKRGDFLEAQIANYAQQNEQWCGIWSEKVGTGKHHDEYAFRVVEEHMASPDRDQTHLAWLESVTANARGDRKVPFHWQADAFEHVYKRSNFLYGNHRLTR